MKHLPWIFFALGAMPITACSTPGAVSVEVSGIEQFAAPCPNRPPVLSDLEIQELLRTLPEAEQRERLFWASRDRAHRAYELCEARRADGAVTLVARHNQIVREHD